MKKLLLLPTVLLLWTEASYSQCEQPTQLPYIENSDTTVAGFVPECMSTSWSSFASMNVFEVVEGPVEGFQGNVLAYDTTINPSSGMPSNATINARLTTPNFEMTAGMAYMVYFLYRNSDSNFSISEVTVYLNGTDVLIGSLSNISDSEPTNFISEFFTPPTDGIYNISVVVNSEGGQGIFYLDSFMVMQTGTLGKDNSKFETLAVFPNPVQDVLHISNRDTIDQVEIYSSTGQLVLKSNEASTDPTLSLSHLASGVYFLNMSSAEQTQRTKIIKQ